MKRFFLILVMLFSLISLNSATYYIDSVGGLDTNNGTTSETAWQTLTKVNSTTFVAGDSILFKRGCIWNGLLNPKGSGSIVANILISTYGVGVLPQINGGFNEEAFLLWDQSYWKVQSIDFKGGTRNTIRISGSNVAGVINGITLESIVVHDLWTGVIPPIKHYGLLVIEATELKKFNNVILDNVTAYGTDQWVGIMVGRAWYNEVTPSWTTNVTIKNCTAYNTYGDTIVAWECANGVMENNVCYNSGMSPDAIIMDDPYTPKVIEEATATSAGLWTWGCLNFVVQLNESYDHKTPAYDGSAFDVDYYNTNQKLQYNYAHGCDGSGVYVFSAKGSTANYIQIRYNLFTDNNKKDFRYHANLQGEVNFTTWASGILGNIVVYNNTIYSNPVDSTMFAVYEFDGIIWNTDTHQFINNIVYSTNGYFVRRIGMNYDYNCYYTTEGNPVYFVNNSSRLLDFKRWVGKQALQDINGMFADPKLNILTDYTIQYGSPCIDVGTDLSCLGYVSDMGTQDYFGNSIPYNNCYDIGANEYRPEQ